MKKIIIEVQEDGTVRIFGTDGYEEYEPFDSEDEVHEWLERNNGRRVSYLRPADNLNGLWEID